MQLPSKKYKKECYLVGQNYLLGNVKGEVLIGLSGSLKIPSLAQVVN